MPDADDAVATTTGYEALARALLRHEAAVYGVPGTPASELGDACEALTGETIWSLNERVAFEMAFGFAATGRNAAVVCKQVGALALADSLANAALHSGGGGLLLVVADDVGPEFSTIEADGRLLGEALRLPVFDVADPTAAVTAAYEGFRLSAATRLPVIVRASQHALRLPAPAPALPDPPPAGRPLDHALVNGLTKPGRHARFWRDVQPGLSARLEALLEGPSFSRPTAGSSTGTAVVAAGYPAVLARELSVPVVELPVCCPLSPWPALLEALAPCEHLLVAEDYAPVLERELLAVLAPGGTAGRLRGRLTGHLPPFGPVSREELQAALTAVEQPRLTWTLDEPVQRGPARFAPHVEGLFGAVTALREELPDLLLSVDVGSPNRLRAADMALALGGPASTAAGAALAGRPSLAVVGDYGFFHSAWPALLEAAARQAPMVAVILLNRRMDLTGGQLLRVPAQLLTRDGFTRLLEASGLGEPVWLELPQPTGEVQGVLRSLIAEKRFRVVVAEDGALEA